MAGVNPNLPLADVKTMESISRRSLARTSLALVLLAIASGMSLLVGVVGIYGVISYTVSQRTREVGNPAGPRGAARRRHPGCSCATAWLYPALAQFAVWRRHFALTRLMESMLFEVSPADPLTYAAASAALIVAATPWKLSAGPQSCQGRSGGSNPRRVTAFRARLSYQKAVCATRPVLAGIKPGIRFVTQHLDRHLRRHFLLLTSCARPSENVWGPHGPRSLRTRKISVAGSATGAVDGCAERGLAVTTTPAYRRPYHISTR